MDEDTFNVTNKKKVFVNRKKLVRNAQESKDDWSDEDLFFPKVSDKRKYNAWTQPLITGPILSLDVLVVITSCVSLSVAHHKQKRKPGPEEEGE